MVPLAARARLIRPGVEGPGAVVYWMSRDQRARENWALLFAQSEALRRREPLVVAFCLAPSFPGAALRHYDFMLRGLEETAADLAAKGIAFALLEGDPGRRIPEFIAGTGAGILVADFDPLRIKVQWRRTVAAAVRVPFHEVDAHNIVPCWTASPKQEFAARTFRPKISRLLADYLDEFPPLTDHPHRFRGRLPAPDFTRALRHLGPDRSVPPVSWIRPGPAAGRRALGAFLRRRLDGYGARRNDPTVDGQSGLSPWLHFGQISAQRVALAVRDAAAPAADRAAFLEELIVRREISDNFCHYQDRHDSFEGLPAWSRRTLDAHRADPRPYRYSPEELEGARTHDPLWNAAQRELVARGKMHGWVRMYWAKKILEWTGSPEDAIAEALRLNDRYELDGRDPNGCVGVLWSVGGLHDRPWSERPVFGRVRYMSLNGARGKFDVAAYVRMAERLTGERVPGAESPSLARARARE